LSGKKVADFPAPVCHIEKKYINRPGLNHLLLAGFLSVGVIIYGHILDYTSNNKNLNLR